MGSGDWLKNIISSNKARKQRSNTMKEYASPEINKFELKPRSLKKPTNIGNGNRGVVGRLAEDIAAIRIQTAFRAFKARKLFFNLKRLVRLQMLMEGDFGKKQTPNTLSNLQSWSKIQDRIRTHRLSMVEDRGIKQKKLENQLRLEAKARDQEVEWTGGSHTMVETLARMKQREEAAVKRERAMAYAFSHQPILLLQAPTSAFSGYISRCLTGGGTKLIDFGTSKFWLFGVDFFFYGVYHQDPNKINLKNKDRHVN